MDNKQCLVNASTEYAFLAAKYCDFSSYQVSFLQADKVLFSALVDANNARDNAMTVENAINLSRLVHFVTDDYDSLALSRECDSVFIRDLCSVKSMRVKRRVNGKFTNDFLFRLAAAPDMDIYTSFTKSIERIINGDTQVSLASFSTIDKSKEGSDFTNEEGMSTFEPNSKGDGQDNIVTATGNLTGGFTIDGSADEPTEHKVYIDEPKNQVATFLTIHNPDGIYDNFASMALYQLEYLLFLANYRGALYNIPLDANIIKKIISENKNPYYPMIKEFKLRKSSIIGVLLGQVGFMINSIFKGCDCIIQNTPSGSLTIDITTSQKIVDLLDKSKFKAQFIGANRTGADTFANWLMWRFGIMIPDSMIKRFLVNVPGFEPIKNIRNWLDSFGSDVTGDVKNSRKDIAFCIALLCGLNISVIRDSFLSVISRHCAHKSTRYDYWACLLSNFSHIWFLGNVKQIKVVATNSENINTTNFTNFILLPGIYQHQNVKFSGFIPCVLSLDSKEQSIAVRLNQQDVYLFPSAKIGIVGVDEQSFADEIREYLQHETVTFGCVGVELRSETLSSMSSGYLAGFEYISGLCSKYPFGLITRVDSYGIKLRSAAVGINNDTSVLVLDAENYFEATESEDSGLDSSYQRKTEAGWGSSSSRAEYTEDINQAQFSGGDLSKMYNQTPYETFMAKEQQLIESVKKTFQRSMPYYQTQDASNGNIYERPQEVYFTE